MKKISAIILSALLLISIAGCNSNTKTYAPSKANWLSENSITPPEGFRETCTYTLSYKKSENGNERVSVEYDESTYVTELSAIDAANNTYLLKTTYDISGKYTVGETEYPFHDVSEAETTFVWNGGFAMQKSVQHAQSTLPVNATATAESGKSPIVQTEYVSTITYEGTTATTELSIKQGEEYFSLKDGATGTFKKYTKSNYIDSNMLAFFVRAFDFSDSSLTYSFNTIDALNKTKHAMSLSMGTSASEEVTFVRTGDRARTFNSAKADIVNFTMGINETYRGYSMTYRYFKNADGFRHYLYQMISVLPYDLGTLTYTLTSVGGENGN